MRLMINLGTACESDPLALSASEHPTSSRRHSRRPGPPPRSAFYSRQTGPTNVHLSEHDVLSAAECQTKKLSYKKPIRYFATKMGQTIEFPGAFEHLLNERLYLSEQKHVRIRILTSLRCADSHNAETAP
jgi:hypothetical protein